RQELSSFLLCVPCGLISLFSVLKAEGTVSGSLLLTCTVKGARLDSPYYDWNCVRLSPGGELQFLGWIYPFGNNTGYAPSFQDRVTISADKAKNKVSLQLHTLSATDRATYFCARQGIFFFCDTKTL
uniref:Ig-like domain-containing protein n=1 Tax=Phasianus colchicus TaxID=9054 RepID=A0A669PTS9_PHACC